jgi:hypothetical protein
VKRILGKNEAMKLLLAKAAADARIGHSLTAPKLALQISEPGYKGLFLLKRRV